MLPTRAARTIDINPYILIHNRDLNILFKFGHHIHRTKRRMAFTVGIKGANAHQTMYPSLGF